MASVKTIFTGQVTSTSPITFVVPAGVTSIVFECFGQWGQPLVNTEGSPLWNSLHTGGPPGYTKGTLAVTPGDTYYLYPGSSGKITGASKGGLGRQFENDPLNNGFISAGSGGDASDIRHGGTAFANRIMVAGGGGGGRAYDDRDQNTFYGYYGPNIGTGWTPFPTTPNPPFVFPGGPSFSPNNKAPWTQGNNPAITGYYVNGDFGGAAGTDASGTTVNGKHGTGAAGGAAGTGTQATAATAGALGVGGNGGLGNQTSVNVYAPNSAGGGGGGGLYGGGGGAAPNSATAPGTLAGGGGGGSNYIDPGFTVTTNILGASLPRDTAILDGYGAIIASYVQPPSPPVISNTPLTGGTVPANAALTVGWAYSSLFAGTTQSAFDIEYSSNGGTTYTVVGQPGNTANFYTFAANFFTPATAYLIRVRTYDNFGDVGSYSDAFSFTAVTPITAPTITAPTDGALLTDGSFNVTWTIPAGVENSWQVQVIDRFGTIYADSGVVASAALTYAVAIVPGPFVHPGDITVRVKYTTTTSGGVFSDWAVVTVNLNFDPPDVPGVSMTVDNDNGKVIFAISNPTTDFATVSNDVYRTDITNSGDEIRIGTQIPPNSTFTDYTAASGVTYHYKVRAYSAVGGYADKD